MNWLEHLRIALRALAMNKGRSILTMIGMIIGTAAVVATVSIGLGGKQFVLGQIEKLGANLIYVYWEGFFGSSQQQEKTLTKYDLTEKDVRYLAERIPSLQAIAPIVWSYATIFYEAKERQVTLLGTTADYKPVRSIVVEKGRFLVPEDIRARRKVCLITPVLSQKLFGPNSPLQRSLRLNNIKFLIIGTFREGISTGGGSEVTQETVMIPMSVAQYFTGTNKVDFIYMQATSSHQVKPAMEQIKQALLLRHGREAVYRVDSLSQLLEAVGAVSTVLASVVGLVAGLSLVVGGVGIMNIMLVTVTERTREIGLRIALGARHTDILMQFLSEAIVLSMAGGLIGIILGALIPSLIAKLTGFPLPISLSSVLVAFAVSSIVGVFFGFYPARKAARLNPIEALRHE